MRKMFQKLWQDDAGIVALEYLLVGTIVGLGLVVGLSNLEIALDVELSELANAITALDQGYSFIGLQSNNGSYKTGTCATDFYGSQSLGSMSASCVPLSFAVP